MVGPKKRTSKSRKGMRRSHDALSTSIKSTECPNCGELKLPHHVCTACGYYGKDKLVVSPKVKKEAAAATA